MKISKVSVQGLFGTLDHEIPLGSGGITFIHGPNGCGKTTVLRLVHLLISGELHTLKSIDFKELKVTYADSHSLLVTRTVTHESAKQPFDEEEELLRATVEINIGLLNAKGKELNRFEYSKKLQKMNASDFRFPMSSVDRRLPFLTRTAPQQWQDQRSGQFLNLDTVIAKYGERLNLGADFQWPTWLTERLGESKIGFVRTQRLINISTIARGPRSEELKEPRDVVEIYSSQIKETIAKKLAESAVQSQARDRSFPIRLINKEFVKNVPQTEFLETYRSTEERAQNLMSAGLLDQAASIPLPQRNLTKLERDVLALYLSDFNEKLDAFADLQRRIEALVDVVGSKLRRKRFVIDRQKGFVFETYDNPPRKLNVTDLSSGEQHQIVLFYELIFASAGIDLFLIDEPEISLHVEWQRAFISDIEKVQALTGATFLVATHSPQVINNRRDLAVPLDGGLPE
jgi:ABC-type transport system involved in cytochrome c biogenesis ATPase subunit